MRIVKPWRSTAVLRFAVSREDAWMVYEVGPGLGISVPTPGCHCRQVKKTGAEGSGAWHLPPLCWVPCLVFAQLCGSARLLVSSPSPMALHVGTPSPLWLCVGSLSAVALCTGSTSPPCLSVGSSLVFQLLLGGIVRAVTVSVGAGGLASPCPKLGAAGRVCASLASSGCSSSCVTCELGHFSFFPESVKDSVSYGVCATLHADSCGDCRPCSCVFPWWLVSIRLCSGFSAPFHELVALVASPVLVARFVSLPWWLASCSRLCVS